ncbi:hypothetical protein ACFPOD_13525 [Nitratireductor kimnyeongensis]|uniref:Uncharacterized protein n=1 Tax=Nitratireductor kimnyeongensis TaxID=430679 RepID=A0ABW0TBQ8_9HYPH|nr:hypothetical protein [Nitratireductor kimnyeongensis]QZZ35480.1 hypothetical protein KW403_17320 [Nitratireductor kimnyeongensis]
MEKLAYAVIGASFGVALMAILPLVQGGDTPPLQSVNAMEMTSDTNSPATARMQMNAMAEHSHPPREVAPDGPVPSVTHLMFPDVMDGYNVQILPVNFAFTPADINREVQDNEGHAHIYVNGMKISRVYGQWFHLPAKLLKPGLNEVTVTLNANDHSEWALDGVPISSTFQVKVAN